MKAILRRQLALQLRVLLAVRIRENRPHDPTTCVHCQAWKLP